ncbi:PaREP1 family protein [Pyrodictium abyssi]|uniref:PaREP1 family protein n=1 Tax=Pyrodictium abyssi TaxID=54256 RepID=A0ABN6ZLG6_9CREN|nr:PaREP1 family protein [Pyrodictium abyssi]
MGSIDASVLEKPLPKPERSLVGYASARVLEALLEALLALEFLERGYTRNAAGKAFQAWRALIAAILALERDRIAEKLGDKERKWLLERAVARLPTTQLRPLARLVEEAGYPYYDPLTDKALNLHDYQYHGPDPDMALSKYRSREEAAWDILYILGKLAEIVEERVKPRLEEEGKVG